MNIVAILLLPLAVVLAVPRWIFRKISRLFYKKYSKTPIIAFRQNTNFRIGKTPLLREVAKYLGAPVVIQDNDSMNVKMMKEAGINVLDGTVREALESSQVYGKQYPAVIVDGDPKFADISILVFDDFYGTGNGLLFPAGPLTNGTRSAIKESDAVLIIQTDAASVPIDIVKLAKKYNRPLFLARREMDVQGIFGKFVAWTSIPRPVRFFESLRSVPVIRVVDRVKFKPGKILEKAEIIGLFHTARRFEARLITTEKDWYGLSRNIQQKVKRASVRMSLPPNFFMWLEKKLGEKNG